MSRGFTPIRGRLALACALASSATLVAGCGLLQPEQPDPLDLTIAVFGDANNTTTDLLVKEVQKAVDSIPSQSEWAIKVVSIDDGSDPRKASEAAAELAEEETLLGIVGSTTPETAVAIQERFLNQQVFQLSVADTRTALTRGADVENPQRPFQGFFRFSANDDVQAKVAAKYVASTLEAKQVAVVTDGSPRSDARVSVFRAALRDAGVTARETLVITDSKSRKQAVKALQSADVVYFGAGAQEAALLSRAAGQYRGWSLLTGDDLPLAGLGPQGLRVGDASTAPSTGDNADPLVRPALDAAAVLRDVLPGCIADTTSYSRVRSRCLSAVSQVSIDGASGNVSFDDFGDLGLPRASVLVATAEGWDSALTASPE